MVVFTHPKRWFFGIFRTMNSMYDCWQFHLFFWCLYQLYQLLLLLNSYQKVPGEKIGHQHIPTCCTKKSHTSQCARHTLGFVKTKDPEKLVLSCQHFPVPQDAEGFLMLKRTHMTSMYHYQLILALFLTNA